MTTQLLLLCTGFELSRELNQPDRAFLHIRSLQGTTLLTPIPVEDLPAYITALLPEGLRDSRGQPITDCVVPPPSPEVPT